MTRPNPLTYYIHINAILSITPVCNSTLIIEYAHAHTHA
nr:MAG TPA: hypothetical protein [Caudoviricetes sp.]